MALSSRKVITISQAKNAKNGSQKMNSPVQDSGPDLKNTTTVPGVNISPTQMLKYPDQRGNTGVARRSCRISAPMITHWTNAVESTPKKVSQPQSLSTCCT